MAALRRGLWFSAVDFTPMTDAEDQDNQVIVLDLTDDSVIADPVTPELSQTGAVQSCPNAAGGN